MSLTWVLVGKRLSTLYSEVETDFPSENGMTNKIFPLYVIKQSVFIVTLQFVSLLILLFIQ